MDIPSPPVSPVFPKRRRVTQMTILPHFGSRGRYSRGLRPIAPLDPEPHTPDGSPLTSYVLSPSVTFRKSQTPSKLVLTHYLPNINCDYRFLLAQIRQRLLHPSVAHVVYVGRIRDTRHPAYGERGLFALRRIHPCELIGLYFGRLDHFRRQPDHRTTQYLFHLETTGRGGILAIDASRDHNELAFANTATGQMVNNAQFLPLEIHETNGDIIPLIAVVAITAIQPREEVLIQYSDETPHF